jgi:hypothetical protein
VSVANLFLNFLSASWTVVGVLLAVGALGVVYQSRHLPLQEGGAEGMRARRSGWFSVEAAILTAIFVALALTPIPLPIVFGFVVIAAALLFLREYLNARQVLKAEAREDLAAQRGDEGSRGTGVRSCNETRSGEPER